MKVAICDDDQNTLEQISCYIHMWMEQNKLALPEISQFNSAESFLFHWSPTADFDLLFLDISMGSTSGIELAQIIRKINQDISIVFVTGSREYILEGYEVDALNYLLKPISRTDCFKCLDRAKKKLTKVVEQSLIVETNKKVQRINYSDILYIESIAHYITVHSHKEKFRFRKNLSEIEAALDSKQFARTHRSFLANIQKIIEITKGELVLEGNIKIPVSQSRWQEVNQVFIKYHLES